MAKFESKNTQAFKRRNKRTFMMCQSTNFPFNSRQVDYPFGLLLALESLLLFSRSTSCLFHKYHLSGVSGVVKCLESGCLVVCLFVCMWGQIHQFSFGVVGTLGKGKLKSQCITVFWDLWRSEGEKDKKIS